MQYPRIHLNGTDPERLLEQYMTALEKSQEALQALRMIEVHGRDYYPISSEAASVAMREHQARCTHLGVVVDDLSKIADHILGAIMERKERK